MVKASMIVICLLAGGQTPHEPASLPGVPISQEHHHHLVLQNEYVKAYEVEVPPHEATLMHQHLNDYVYVVFGDSDFTNAVAGKAETKVKAPDLAVNFSRGPFAHIAKNDAETPFRNITIELLRPQGEVKKYYPTLSEALSRVVSGDRGLGSATVLETGEVSVVAFGVTPNGKWSVPRDNRNRLIVITNRIFEVSAKEMDSPFPAGMLKWVPAGQAWTLSNKYKSVEMLMVIEFKDTASRD